MTEEKTYSIPRITIVVSVFVRLFFGVSIKMAHPPNDGKRADDFLVELGHFTSLKHILLMVQPFSVDVSDVVVANVVADFVNFTIALILKKDYYAIFSLNY